MENIDIDIDIDKDNLKNIDIDIDIDMAILKNIDIDIDIDKGILQNIDIDKISYRLGFGISNPPRSVSKTKVTVNCAQNKLKQESNRSKQYIREKKRPQTIKQLSYHYDFLSFQQILRPWNYID